ncbi:MAG: right-handed parallel beta-helix repeat-containing protein [Cyanobacteria bacterium J06581_3]
MAIITVNSIADKGAGSLRAAVAAAQSGDTITFSKSLAKKTIRLTSGDISITKDITIDGSKVPHLRLDGSGRSRIFSVGKNRSVTVKGLTFTNGRAVVPGKGIGKGGAIWVKNFGSITIENSIFTGNIAERGGAVQVDYGGNSTVKNSQFYHNNGAVSNDGFSGGAIATAGSGPRGENQGFLRIEGSKFINNRGTNGGAIYVLQGPLTLTNSIVKGNRATSGGGVFTDGGLVKIVGSKLINNTSRGPGGGALLWGYQRADTLIEDSVLSGNRSTNNRGGGAIVGPDGKFTIRNSTVRNNSAFKKGGGLWTDSKQGVTVEGTTFSQNKSTADAGGALSLNTPSGTIVQISHSTFVDNASERDAATIWLNRKNRNDIILSNSVLAGKGSVNYSMSDGGNNYASTSILGPKISANATYLEDLHLSTAQQVGSHIVYVPQSNSPLIRKGKDIGAFDTLLPILPNNQSGSNNLDSDPSPLIESEASRILQASALSINGTKGTQYWGDGVTIRGYGINGDAAKISRSKDAIGISGGRYDKQIDYDSVSDRSEKIVIDFGSSVDRASVELGLMLKSAWRKLPETGIWTAYNDNAVLIGQGVFDPSLGVEIDTRSFRFEIDVNTSFKQLVIQASAYGNGEGKARKNNNSDFNIRNVTYIRGAAEERPTVSTKLKGQDTERDPLTGQSLIQAQESASNTLSRSIISRSLTEPFSVQAPVAIVSTQAEDFVAYSENNDSQIGESSIGKNLGNIETKQIAGMTDDSAIKTTLYGDDDYNILNVSHHFITRDFLSSTSKNTFIEPI